MLISTKAEDDKVKVAEACECLIMLAIGGNPDKEKVNKLKQAGAIKDIFYLEWLANTVVVKKNNGKWRVCVDFTDLNKVCPNDLFPVSRIDQLVDTTFRHP